MKKVILSIFALILCLSVFFSPSTTLAEQENNVFIVTANEATIFISADLSSKKVGSLKHKTEIIIEFENGNAKEYGESGFTFYHIQKNEIEGYVLADLVVPKNEFITTIPKFNARTNGKSIVYFLKDGKYVESDIILQKHERIFLYEGFDRKKEFNAVAFVYENEVVYGYLKKGTIDPDGVNPLIISIAGISIAVIGIILALVFIKKKKRKTGVSKVKN